MTQVAEVMTRGIRTMSPDDSLQLAAQAMDELNVGVLPVCEQDRLVGMVTDRDITVRGVAQGRPVERTPLREVMSADVQCCHADESLEEVTRRMESAQIRRLPVLDEREQLVGIVSLGDVAAKASETQAGQALSGISQPAEPDRAGTSSASGTAGGGSASGIASRMPG